MSGASPSALRTSDGTAALGSRYRAVRRATEALAEGLSPEDCAIQSMTDASPVRWHLAHTTWFFETFVVAKARPDLPPHHPAFAVLFNSYYHSVGPQFPRAERGLLSRPGLREILEYRAVVDERVARILERGDVGAELPAVVELGLQHEQQHQELILTDLKHLLSLNPLAPVYRPRKTSPARRAAPLQWAATEGGLHWVGHDGDGFAFDNEGERHRTWLEPFQIASRLVTNGEYLAFVGDGGYERPSLWLSDGWAEVRAQKWTAPLHWRWRDPGWEQFTFAGLEPLDPAEPVSHVSLYEADAYARWAGARLPSEEEWEAVAAAPLPVEGNFADDGFLRPLAADDTSETPAQLFGDLWEWTRSPYTAYPGFRPFPEGLGEYNGKFMANQFVLRGGSCATPRGHVRSTYRNFFPPSARWQFTGIRLARS